MTKPAPQLSPFCPPNSLFMQYGINIEVKKPDKIQEINNKLLDKSKFFESRKKLITRQIIIIDGLISFDIPFQYFLWMELDSFLKRH